MLVDVEGVQEVVVIIEHDVGRAGPVLQDGDHVTHQAAVLIVHKGAQATVGRR